MSVQIWIALVLGVAASVEDIRHRNISNWIPLAALLAGFAWQIHSKGWVGIGAAAAGAALGFGVFLLFYLLGGMGGGDVKLMAGFGALLGVSRLLEAALWTALLGGILAAAAIAVSALRARLSGKASTQRVKAIPYAPAISAGVWLSLVPR